MDEIASFLTQIDQDNFYPMYRGQANIEWSLTPSIGRLLDSLPSKIHFDSWEQIENDLLNQFKRFSSPYLKKTPNGRIEWLVEAQHYGLATPLLDWTTSPLKALYFAVENKAYHNMDGAVYVIEPSCVSLSSDAKDSYDYYDCYYPKHSNERVIAQSGCFMIFPYPKSLKPLGDLKDRSFGSSSYTILRKYREIKIYAKIKPKLLNQLSTLGINTMSMYPGIEGVTSQIMSAFR